MARTIKVAAAQYAFDEITAFSAFEDKISDWVKEAVNEDADLLLFPEYGALELALLGGAEAALNAAASLLAVQKWLTAYEEVFAGCSRRHGVTILAGSAPVQLDGGRIINRSTLFHPGGGRARQDKQLMTRSEAEEWGMVSRPGLAVFDIGACKLGIAICYDSEFPLIVRTLAEAGAEVLLVPSCTGTLAGYHRVSNACKARALENQIYVVHAPTVGPAPWLAAADVNIGRAGIYGPPDRHLVEDGILALGEMNKPGWVYTDLDLEGLMRVQADGEVLNSRDWNLQPGISPLPKVPVIGLV